MDGAEIVFIVRESAEGGFEARAVGFDIYAQADSISDLRTMINDAVECHFDESERPAVIRLHRTNGAPRS